MVFEEDIRGWELMEERVRGKGRCEYLPSSDIFIETIAVIGHVGRKNVLVVIAKEAVAGLVVIGLRVPSGMIV